MVSTRGVKFKFSEGEKVLCYEPDPTKAKVLYDSKVLELNVNRDHRGRKAPEYLIHFYGWSSSWDRWVKEEFILPDTEENQNLQLRLAKDAALSLKSRNIKVKLPPIIKESLAKTKDELEENSVKDHPDIENTEAAESSANESSDSESERHIEIRLPQVLKDVLDEDWLFITQKDKVFKIPCEINVVSILENYVQHLATELLSADTSKSGKSEKEALRNNAEDKINLCKEVMDGIRVYFDFTLPHLLLYRQEKKQFYTVGNTCSVAGKLKSMKSNYVNSTSDSMPIAVVPKEEPKSPISSPTRNLRKQSSSRKFSTSNDEDTGDVSPRQKGRPRAKKMRTAAPRRCLRSSDKMKSTDDEMNDSSDMNASSAAENNQSPPRSNSPSIPTSSSRQSLRSAAHAPSNNTKSASNHKRATNASTPNSPTLTANSLHSTVTVCISNINPVPAVKTEKTLYDTPLPVDIHSWSMVPLNLYRQVPAAPSLVYGGQHLLRLFVKLPELIAKSPVRQTYMETIVTILQNFLSYLVERRDEIFVASYVDSSERSVDGSGISNQ